MKWKNFFDSEKNILVVVFISFFFLLNIYFLQRYFLINWDESVYIGMAKYIASFGKIGLFEPLRPIALPIVLSLVWSVGLKSVMAFRIVELLFACGSLFLVHTISSYLFNKRAGLTAVLILGTTPLFFQNSFQIMTEIPSIFFALLALYFLLKERLFLSGLFSGITFLFKFPQGLVFLGIFIALFIYKFSSNLSLKKFVLYSKNYFIAFAFVMLIFMSYNFITYVDVADKIYQAPLYSILKGAEHQNNPTHAINSLFEAITFYPYQLLKDNLTLLFFIPGILFLLNKKFLFSKKSALILILLLLCLYFTQIINKQLRFGLLFLPYIAIISSFGFEKLFSYKNKIVKSLSFVILFVLIISSFVNIEKHNYNQQFDSEPAIVSEIYKYFENFKGVVSTTIPIPAAYTNIRYEPFYYSVNESFIYYNEHNQSSDALIFNYNFFPCSYYGQDCIDKKNKLFEMIQEDFDLVFNKSLFYEEYLIYLKK